MNTVQTGIASNLAKCVVRLERPSVKSYSGIYCLSWAPLFMANNCHSARRLLPGTKGFNCIYMFGHGSLMELKANEVYTVAIQRCSVTSRTAMCHVLDVACMQQSSCAPAADLT